MSFCKVKSILYVCAGNTCRNYMAQVYTGLMLNRWNVRGVQMMFAGVAASPSGAGAELNSHETVNINGI